mmetsp:Transcript_4478/g.9788  ORF Transcript_4478/g.9788 Transcript_4478/m.9788 type:complete len:300 (-) Transcript_4478:52-951(-)
MREPLEFLHARRERSVLLSCASIAPAVPREVLPVAVCRRASVGGCVGNGDAGGDDANDAEHGAATHDPRLVLLQPVGQHLAQRLVRRARRQRLQQQLRRLRVVPAPLPHPLEKLDEHLVGRAVAPVGKSEGEPKLDDEGSLQDAPPPQLRVGVTLHHRLVVEQPPRNHLQRLCHVLVGAIIISAIGGVTARQSLLLQRLLEPQRAAHCMHRVHHRLVGHKPLAQLELLQQPGAPAVQSPIGKSFRSRNLSYPIPPLVHDWRRLDSRSLHGTAAAMERRVCVRKVIKREAPPTALCVRSA